MKKKKHLPPKDQVWVDARQKFHLSHAQIQMARELGMNPKKFGGLANHKQEPWKAPLPQFIENLYFKRFGKEQPDNVRSVEQMLNDKKRKKEEQNRRKRETVEADSPANPIAESAKPVSGEDSIDEPDSEIPF